MKKLKEVMIMMFCISFVITSFGCLPKDVSTEKGEQLSKDFVLAYTLLDYSEELSTTVGNVTNDLLQRDLINEDQKDEIGVIWVNHKIYNNKLQKEVEIWYDALNEGRKVYNKDKVLHLVSLLAEETRTLEIIMDKYIEGVHVPDTLIDRIISLSELINKE